MKVRHKILIAILLSVTSTLFSQEKFKNYLEFGDGTAISCENFYNRTRDLSYTRILGRKIGVSVGINYKEFNLKSENTPNDTPPKFFSHIIYLGIRYEYSITDNLSVVPKISFGYCWQMYVIRNDFYCNSWQAYCPALSLQARYCFSTHWCIFAEYSYNMPFIFWGSPETYYGRLFQPQKSFYFNHAIKLGISFRF